MNVTMTVPSIKCEGCASNIIKEIKVYDADADVKIDVEKKLVEVTTDLPEFSIKQVITAAGHQVV